MATPIRPNFPQAAPPIQGAQRPDAAAGQRAFFQAALGQQPTHAAASAEPSARPPPAGRIPTSLPAEPPEKILRPGSLLDIRV